MGKSVVGPCLGIEFLLLPRDLKRIGNVYKNRKSCLPSYAANFEIL